MGEVLRTQPTTPAPVSLRAAAGDGVDWRVDPLPTAGQADDGTRWHDRWTYRTPPCRPIEVGPGGCRTATLGRDWDPKRPVAFEGQPFGFEAQLECSWGIDADGLLAEARAAFERGASAAVATELWSGEQARGEIDEAGTSGYEGNRWLTRSDDPVSAITTLNGGDPTQPVGALGLIESYLACCSDIGRGVVHVPPALLAVFRNLGLLLEPTTPTGRRYTPAGHTVVSDCGYDGTAPGTAAAGPTAPAAGTLWIYATGPIVARVSALTPIGTNEDVAALLATTNDRVAVASGLAMVAWGCCHAGIAVDVSDYDLGS